LPSSTWPQASLLARLDRHFFCGGGEAPLPIDGRKLQVHVDWDADRELDDRSVGR